jgi:hypothetical protein
MPFMAAAIKDSSWQQSASIYHGNFKCITA